MIPSPAQADRRLAQMLAADSAQTGENASTDRLMFMLTRSCELRCSYCFVGLTESGYQTPNPGAPEPGSRDAPPLGDMALPTALAAVDLLMTSPKPRLSLQLFGGEPTRRWDLVEAILRYATTHPARAGRELQLQLTTNGLGLTPPRLELLAALDVTVQLSVDGLGAHNRFRRAFLSNETETADLTAAGLTALRDGPARWFLNVTVPPSAADELPARYADAIAARAPALQLNYATGMRWTSTQRDAWLRGLAEVLLHHHQHPRLTLFNAGGSADPAPLCGDVLVDVDGTLLQVGGVFHERRFPALRKAYWHGHVRTAGVWQGHRASLAELWRRTTSVLSPEEAEIFASAMRIGAAADLVARTLRARP